MGVSVEAVEAPAADNPQRPSILVVGPKDVGKRSLVRRLVRGAKSAQTSIPGGVVTSHRWSIDTKYYTADVNLWVSHSEDLLEDTAKAQALAAGCDALVLVFDLSEEASFASVQDWASSLDLATFDVLLCIANKADLVPDHHAHDSLQQERPLQWEQRHRLVEAGDSSDANEPSVGFGRPTKALDVRRQEYSEWCLDNGVEYIEACTLDEHFDQRISVDGDMQGIARLRSALHAHMWPSMVMKPKPGARPPRALSSGDESDFSTEYELLEEDGGRGGLSPERNAGASEPVRVDVCAGGVEKARRKRGGVAGIRDARPRNRKVKVRVRRAGKKSPGRKQSQRKRKRGSARLLLRLRLRPSGAMPERLSVDSAGPVNPVPSEERAKDLNGNASLHLDEAAAMREVEHEGDSDFAEMERIMHQMSSVRDRLSGLPDGARREEAARYAMRLMQMFGGESDGEAE
ncbi:hypothetical protein KFL_001140180 [Klebsormidium nitens]|uniref:Uncharacterized protein n=1 Tax=Klebsormidium nitens TaxID=105231 RepID=A0A1Y1HV67_KLENI|nr:hypothetical protein KFL_001140180 [Klebsormidium nitens]|eukprot:GAQ82530.1 hypothetical protein KFL_001140180 [Klebsormidium nitens]